MSKVRIEINREAVGDLLKSNDMMKLCSSFADRAIAQLGDGYTSTTHVGKTRLNVEIAAESYEAKQENLKSNSILKALGAVKE